jgi:hypothetical protein
VTRTIVGGQILLCSALLLAAPASPATAAEAGATAAADDESPELAGLLQKLAARADLYRKYALGFTCEESLVKTYYDPDKGSFKRRQREVYDYLFERSAKTGRLGEVREIIEENGRPVRRSTRDLDLEIPPSYAWSQIFAAENRGKFHFKLLGKILKGYKLLIEFDFTGWAAEPGTADIGGWSGRASVDSSTLNLAEITAEPSGQVSRIEAEKLKYQRAFAIMGVPLAGRPKSRSLGVLFGFQNEDLTYPTETTIAESVYVRSAEMGLEKRTLLTYRSYRFFKVGTEAEEARPAPAADPNLDPNAMPPASTPPSPPPDPNRPRR